MEGADSLIRHICFLTSYYYWSVNLAPSLTVTTHPTPSHPTQNSTLPVSPPPSVYSSPSHSHPPTHTPFPLLSALSTHLLPTPPPPPSPCSDNFLFVVKAVAADFNIFSPACKCQLVWLAPPPTPSPSLHLLHHPLPPLLLQYNTRLGENRKGSFCHHLFFRHHLPLPPPPPTFVWLLPGCVYVTPASGNT